MKKMGISHIKEFLGRLWIKEQDHFNSSGVIIMMGREKHYCPQDRHISTQSRSEWPIVFPEWEIVL